jgi:heavy metal sensor kinase
MFLSRNKPAGGRQSFRSIRVRLTLLFVLLFGASQTVLGILIYGMFVRSHQAQFDAALYNRALDIAQGIEINAFGDVSVRSDILSDNGKNFPFSTGRELVQILKSDGTIVARSAGLGSARLPLYIDDWQVLNRQGFALRTLAVRELPKEFGAKDAYRLLSYLVVDRFLATPHTFILQVAVPMTFLEATLASLLRLLLIAESLMLLGATLLGLIFSRRALAPVTAIIEKAQGLSPSNLSERVPVPAVDDELKTLSETLNELLARLQKAFESQERFVADASHELKTPLAILRGELDVLKLRERSPAEVAEFLSSAGQELNSLSGIVENLLLLARIDAGAGSLAMSRVRLDEVALDVVSKLGRRAKELKIDIRVKLEEGAGGFEVPGDAGLLKSMVQNLVENALKFSPEGGSIGVKLGETADSVEFVVSDSGPGISPEDLAHVFERFYRAESTKQKAPGAGLGLAIVQRIVTAHGGKIDVESAPGQGASFRVRIKKF